MVFVLGKKYSRNTIHEEVGGGSKQAYLLNIGGKVLCACLRLDTNPDAPKIILPGMGR
jgi:hypothetical protein